MPDNMEVLPPTTEPEIPVSQELQQHSRALARERGAALFMGAIQGIIAAQEKQAAQLSRGYATWKLAAESLLAKGVHEDDDYQRAIELCQQAGEVEKQADYAFDAVTAFFFKVHRALTGMRGTAKDPWTRIKDRLNAAAVKWYNVQKEAKRRAELELAKQAEQQQGRLQSEASELLDQGFVKEAREKLQQAAVTLPPTLPSAAPRVANTRVTETYKATCVDVLALAKAIVEGRVPLVHNVRGEERPLLVCDQVVLNAICSVHGNTLKYPGVTVEEVTKIGAVKR